MRREPLAILSAVVLSVNLFLNHPTALAFADERFATQVKLSEPIPGFGMTVDIDGTVRFPSPPFTFSSRVVHLPRRAE
ncbi:MAG: hypothetical protein LC794_15180 [Acidobacteria bacterium]|nr:hypothetical protein [Acidobacteriota bacterium]